MADVESDILMGTLMLKYTYKSNVRVLDIFVSCYKLLENCVTRHSYILFFYSISKLSHSSMRMMEVLECILDNI